MLTQVDKKYWGPIPQVKNWLKEQYEGAITLESVLDVGPGHSPLEWATDAVDFVDVPGTPNFRKCDLANDPLPYEDKSFEFVFCRHTLEDMFNPFLLLRELERVGKAGYIETPSPICELARGVDGASPGWRGYHHHRFIVWVGNGELRFVSKYPLVERLSFAEEPMAAALKTGPKYWNTYYLWKDTINWKHRQSPLDFNIPRDYGPMLADACAQSRAATDSFWAQGISEEPEKIQGLKRAFA